MSAAPPDPHQDTDPAPLDRGDIVNLLGRLRRRLEDEGRKITVVQNRRIMKKVQAAGIAGAASMRPAQQIEQLAAITAEVVPLETHEIEAQLEACRR